MRKQLTRLSYAVLPFTLLLFAVTVASAETLQLVVEKVEDGDTIIVTLKGKAERLQLLPLGVAATQHLQMLVKPGDSLQVSGHFDQRDRYGRILVIAVNGAGGSLNERMVQDGFAILTRYGKIEAKLKARLESLESEAIASKHGLWGERTEVAQAWSGRKN